MEEKADQTHAASTDQTKAEPVEHKTEPQMSKKDPFSLIGKIVAAVVVIALLVGGGLYLGQSMNKNSQNQTQTSPTPSQAGANTTPTLSGQASPSAAPTTNYQVGMKTITAGPAGGTSFGVYAVDIPAGWTNVHEKTDITDKLTITKGAYSLSIYQAPMGGGGCLYPGDAAQEMAQNFTDFVQIQGSSSLLRRSWNKAGNPAGTISYTVCQKGTDSFGSPTAYGAISVKAPEPADPAFMKDIDFMLSSLVQK